MRLFLIVSILVVSNYSLASSLRFIPETISKSGKVGDSSYKLEILISPEKENFEKFVLTIDDKQISILSEMFFAIPSVNFESLEMYLGRSIISEQDLHFGPFEVLIIHFSYYIEGSESCFEHLASYSHNIRTNDYTFISKCVE